MVTNGIIKGDAEVRGNNQTWRNVRVTGELTVFADGFTISDSTLGSFSGSGAMNLTGRRLDIGGALGHDGMHMTSDTGQTGNVLIENSWIHDPNPTDISHYDGIQVRGTRGMILRGNNFDLGPWGEMHNAAIFLETANGGNHDVVIDHNWIGGGGYTLYLFAENVRFTNNVMTESLGRWGLLFPGADLGTITQYGNVWESTGQPATF